MPNYLHNSLMPATWKQFERYWYIFALGVILASLPFSKLGLSIGQMMLAGGWIVERFNTRKLLSSLAGHSAWQNAIRIIPYSVFVLFEGVFNGLKQFYRNKPALLFTSIMLMHIAGLFFTTDFGYALKDLRTKLPLFIIPLILSTSEAFGRKAFYRFMALFILAVLVRSLYNTWMIQAHNFLDIRDVSRNVSHIIFSLLIALAIFTLLFFSIKNKLISLPLRAFTLILVIWFVAYLIISQSFTGVTITIIVMLLLFPLILFTTGKRILQAILFVVIIGVTAGLFFYVRSIVNDYYRINPVDVTTLENYSSRGNPYIHNVYAPQTENGNPLWVYVQWDEMRSTWNQRSLIPFDSLNLKKEPIAYTLVRYLTSKGWRKDGDAVERLSRKEVEAVEKGVANWVYLEEFSIRGRIYEFLLGYDNYRESGNPTGSTLMQRLEFWKASVGIIHENWLTGVGTGDMNIAFADQYEKMQSKLSPDQRWRSHNQFLSIFVGFGIFGLIWFLIAFFYPPFMLKRQNDYFLIVFLIIAILSMLTEDTIESQTGVTFIAVFYSLFLFARKETDPLLFKKSIND